MNKNLSIEVKGLGRGLVVSLVLCLVSAAAVYYSGLKETLLPSLGNIIMIISVFWAGCYVSREHGSKGLVRGISMGLLFFILMLIATYGFNPSLIGLKSFLQSLCICIFSGALGGIAGIGLSENVL